MKLLPSIFLICVIPISCTTVQQIGKVNMISNRNIDSNLDYAVISTYTGGDNYRLRQTRAITIEEAVDATVRTIPGGEFLMNAKIYQVNGRYFAVEGDVWGRTENISHQGFSVGDQVTWKQGRSYLNGVISSLKNDKVCLIILDNREMVEIQYSRLTKIGLPDSR